MQCPHCAEQINDNASKCPYCTGSIRSGNGSGFLVNVFQTGFCTFLLGLWLASTFVDALWWGLIGGIVLGPFMWIYVAFFKPTKG
jgi:hypothetical protein